INDHAGNGRHCGRPRPARARWRHGSGPCRAPRRSKEASSMTDQVRAVPLPIHRAGAIRPLMARLRRLGPGVLLPAVVAAVAATAAPYVATITPIPAMVLALAIGMLFNRLAERAEFRPGIGFCVRTLLRWAVALLGLRIALGEI